MAKQKIETLEELNEFSEKVDTTLDELKANVEKQIEEIKTTAVTPEKLQEIESGLKTLDEKITGVTVIAKGNWKQQDTPPAKAYGLGKFVQAMFEAKHGSRLAVKKLGEMGAKGVRYSGDEAKEEEIVFKGDGIKEGLSSSPMTGDDSVGTYYGSYTVPVDYNGEIARVALDNSQMMGRVRTVPISGITSYWPITTDELAFTAVTNQNTDKTEDNLTLSRATLTTLTYAAYIAIIEEFAEDTLSDIGGVIRDMFGEAWGKKFDTIALADSTYGAIALATNAIAMGTGQASFSSITVADCNEMVSELNSKSKRNGAEFFMHVTSFDGLENETDGMGRYILRQPQEGAPYRIKGHQVVLSDGAPSTSAASTKFVGLGNPKYIYHGERVGYEFKIYDQTQSAMESGQIFLRARTRHAFTLALPGAWVSLATSAS